MASVDLQKLWFQLQRRQWSSFVVIPADPGISAAGVATSLWRVGTLFGNPAPKVLNAERMGPAVISELIRDLTNAKESVSAGVDQQRILVSIESVLTNPQGIGAQAADAVLLCVRRGERRSPPLERRSS